MTEAQKQQIRQMRGRGESYYRIAAALDISENTVKSYCKRNNLGGRLGAATATADDVSQTYCGHCGKALRQNPGTKPRKFCSVACRSAWWASHPERIQKKALYSFTCPVCGTRFTAYGNARRKYCSHACYITSRFGGGRA